MVKEGRSHISSDEGIEGIIKSLYDEYYMKLCLYAEGFVKDHHVAEEIVEDLFIYIWLHSSNLRINNSFKSYLFRSVHNNCLKYLKRTKNRKHLSIDTEHVKNDNEISHPRTADVPLSLIVSKELEEKINGILANMPEQCRRIYLLNCYENLSYSEIAGKLNITVGTVKTQMFRAFQKLRDGLKDYIS